MNIENIQLAYAMGVIISSIVVIYVYWKTKKND